MVWVRSRGCRSVSSGVLALASDAKVRSPLEAIEGFEKVVQLESDRGPEVKW